MAIEDRPRENEMSQTPEYGSALPSPNAHATCGRKVLSDEQQYVCDILQEKLAPAATMMYKACLSCMVCSEHGEKLHLAAHAVREAMSEVATAQQVTWDKQRLHHELDKLKTRFRRLPPGLVSGGALSTETMPDGRLLAFLDEFRIFADWYGNDVGPRRQQAANLFKKAMPGETPALYQSLAKIWVDAYDFFSSVAHYGERVTVDGLAARLRDFQNCLLATRKPEAAADLDAIDQLIQEATPHGHP